MTILSSHRILQVASYGWKHAGEISKTCHVNHIVVFLDIIRCYMKYAMWSNQYKKENFFFLDKVKREAIGLSYKEKNDLRESWVKDTIANNRFFKKWGTFLCEPSDGKKRLAAYTQRYNMGKNCIVSYDVRIERQHFLHGSIRIGNNVILSKHVYIDYSGSVVIKDNVQITNGVIIESHYHAIHSDPTVSSTIITPTSLVIEEGAVIGSRAIILASCHYIGRNARVGAGAVVTKDVPDNSLVVGVPARVIKTYQENVIH